MKLRCFVAMTSDEVAGVLGIAPRAADYHRTHFRIRLLRETQSPRQLGRWLLSDEFAKKLRTGFTDRRHLVSFATRLFSQKRRIDPQYKLHHSTREFRLTSSRACGG